MANANHASADGYIKMLDGISRKTLVFGGNTLMSEFRLGAGKTLPMHSHPEEQIGYLVSGHMALTIGGIKHDLLPGDSWVVPGNIVHGADIYEDSVAVEVFSPVRKDYLP